MVSALIVAVTRYLHVTFLAIFPVLHVSPGWRWWRADVEGQSLRPPWGLATRGRRKLRLAARRRADWRVRGRPSGLWRPWEGNWATSLGVGARNPGRIMEAGGPFSHAQINETPRCKRRKINAQMLELDGWISKARALLAPPPGR
jgi:hypothetical protein